MARGPGVVEHYVVACVRVGLATACATANPGFTPLYQKHPIFFLKKKKVLIKYVF
jgi:hypothetical protein